MTTVPRRDAVVDDAPTAPVLLPRGPATARHRLAVVLAALLAAAAVAALVTVIVVRTPAGRDAGPPVASAAAARVPVTTAVDRTRAATVSTTASTTTAPAAPRAVPAAGPVPVLGWAGWTPGGTGFGAVRPPEINANGDGTSFVEGVRWSSWGGPQAVGRGTAYWVPPNADSAHSVPAAATVVASDPGPCQGRLGYRRLVWFFPQYGETAATNSGYDRICDTP